MDINICFKEAYIFKLIFRYVPKQFVYYVGNWCVNEGS